MFRLISLVVMIIVFITVIIKNRASKKQDIKADNEQTRQPEQSEYQLRKSGLHLFEFSLLPLYIQRIKENPNEEVRFADVSIWKRDIATAIDPKYIDWDEISCEQFGDWKSEFVFVYGFPEPFDIPLAKYGAVYINKKNQVFTYYTLEKASSGYMLCSSSKEEHLNFGGRGDLSKIEFVKEVCQLQGIDESSLLEWRLVKSKSSVKEYPDLAGKVHKEFSASDINAMAELKDDNYDVFISEHPYAVVCFYGLHSGPSRLMLNLLTDYVEDYKGIVTVGKYNVYGFENDTIRERLNITAMPTFLFYKNGKIAQKHIGICPRDVMKSWFEELLS